MRTTLELPDELYQRIKSTAAMQGQSMKEFIANALTKAVSEAAPVKTHAEYAKELRRVAKRIAQDSMGKGSVQDELMRMRNRY